MGKFSKEDAISIVVKCAEQYKENLADRNILLICRSKQNVISTIELSFDASNFLHLTGLKLRQKTGQNRMSAKVFYNRCLSHQLSAADFDLAADGTTPLKLEILPRLLSKDLSVKMIGDYNSRNPKLVTDKLAGNTIACLGFVSSQPSGKYVPNTVLKLDMRDYVSGWLQVIAVYRKPREAKCYEEMTYFAKKVAWDEVNYPEPYSYLEKPVQLQDNHICSV